MRAETADDGGARRGAGRGHHSDPASEPSHATTVHAETVHVDERLIVSPVDGAFFPAFADLSPAHPGEVAIGDEIGVVVQTGEKHAITSHATGRLVGLLALPGERVRRYQPVAWLTVADED